MSDVLNSLKSDLLSRRLLPLVILVLAALVGTVGYAVLGGSGAKTPVAAVAPSSGTPSIVSVTPAAENPTEAVSETPAGTAYQRQGGAHDPFIPLPKPIVVKHKEVVKSAASTTTPSKTPAPSTGGSAPTMPTTPAKPKKPTTEYQVAVLFGPAPPPGQAAALTPYENLKLKAPLPAASNPLIVFRGVSGSAKGAIFVLISPAILAGPAACMPSANQCEAIDLAKGQTEELSYLQPNGQSVTYQLQLVSISKHEISPSASTRNRRESRFGARLLRHRALPLLARLRYVPGKDVVVYRAHKR